MVYGEIRRSLTKQLKALNDYPSKKKLTISSKHKDALGSVLFETVTIGYLIGRYIQGEQLRASGGVAVREPDRSQVIRLSSAGDFKTAWNRPYKKAVKWFMDKEVMNKLDFEELEDLLKSKYFTVAWQDSDYILERIQDVTGAAIRDGLPYSEFKKNLTDMWERIGIGESPMAEWHERLVLRQNTQNAYNAGHYERLFDDPELVSEFPMLAYHAIDDDRVREEHLAMDGKVFKTDDEIWDEWYPPNGFNCRCSVTALHQTKVDDNGLKPDKIPKIKKDGKLKNVKPDTGFQVTPSTMLRSEP